VPACMFRVAPKAADLGPHWARDIGCAQRIVRRRFGGHLAVTASIARAQIRGRRTTARAGARVKKTKHGLVFRGGPGQGRWARMTAGAGSGGASFGNDDPGKHCADMAKRFGRLKPCGGRGFSAALPRRPIIVTGPFNKNFGPAFSAS